MPGQPSSNHKSSKFTGVHLVATSFAAIAGVAIAAYQTLMPGAAPQQPVQVTVVQSPVVEAEVPVSTKTDALAAVPYDLGQGAQFSAALKDGSEQRYNFIELFDSKPETSLAISTPDHEINVLVRFAGDAAQPVTAIEYVPPPQSEGAAATVLDVMVLPEPLLETAGNAIQSFSLQTTPGKQTFAIPADAQGKALWLRIAGPTDEPNIAVGDFRILK